MDTPNQAAPESLPMPTGFPVGGFDRYTAMPGPVGEDEINKGSLATERPSLLGAAFRRENVVGSYLSSTALQTPNDMDPSFNAWKGIEGTKYERYWDRLKGAMNTENMAARLNDIDREEEDRKALDASPILGMLAEMTAGTVDLPTLLPGGALVKGARGGMAVARSAAVVGAAAGAGAAVQEAGLQATQQTRTTAESAFAIGGSVVLGGLLGAGAAAVTNRQWRTMSKKVEDVMSQMGSADQRLDEFAAGAREAANTNMPLADAGAAAMPRIDVDDVTWSGKAARAVGSAAAWLNPSLRLGSSPSAEVRSVGERLLKNSVYLNMHDEGRTLGVATETAMIEHTGAWARSVQAMDGIYADARKAGMQLSEEEFRRVVGRAMRREDGAPLDDPQLWSPVARRDGETDEAFGARLQTAADPVARAAKAWRSTLFDPLKDLAIQQKLLPEDVTVDTAASYFSRMWRREQMVAQEGAVKQRFRDYLRGAIDNDATVFDKAAERRVSNLMREIDDIDMAKTRRAEEMRYREQGGEVSAGEFNEGDLRSAVRLIQGGGGKRPNVDTLTSFIHKMGGLVEDQGELAHRGITSKTRPGFVRSRARTNPNDTGGGWTLDDMAMAAFERGYFPEHTSRPSIDEFLNELEDDFFKRRAVVKTGDRDAVRLQELIGQLEGDLGRIGLDPASPRLSTSEEAKAIVSRVAAALDAEADRKVLALREKIKELQGNHRMERLKRFGDPDGRDFGLAIDDAADQVFATLTGRTMDGSPGYKVTVKSRGPLKERTFNIPDRLVEDLLEDDVSSVGKRYARIMGADVELARNFEGDPSLKSTIDRIRADYDNLRTGVTDEKVLRALDKRQKADLGDIEALRDQLRGNVVASHAEQTFDRISRIANQLNYIRLMGGVVTASLNDIVRVPMVHGMQTLGFGPLAKVLGSDLKKAGIRLSVREAQLAGNVLEAVQNSRLASLIDVTDPYRTRSAAEGFLEKMTDVASRWNGIRWWTDTMKSWASVVTQNRVLDGVSRYGSVKDSERRYLAFLGIDANMADRIAAQFAAHGDEVGGVRVARTQDWTDDAAKRAYYGAINKDVDSAIIQPSAGDIPLFGKTPVGRMALQFKSFTLAANQRVLMRGLQEDQARFWSGLVGMASVGMMISLIKAYESNRQDKLSDNPGYWLGEGLDRSGVLSVPFELSNMAEKIGLYGAKKGLIDLGEVLFPGVSGQEGPSRYSSRGKVGALLGPTVGFAEDLATVLSIPESVAKGDGVTDSQKNAAKSMVPFGSYTGPKQFLNYVMMPPN